MTRRAQQNHKCKDCGRQFVEDPQWQPIPKASKAIIDRLLLEKIPLTGIARVLEISPDWLQSYVNQAYAAVPRKIEVSEKPKRRLTVQDD